MNRKHPYALIASVSLLALTAAAAAVFYTYRNKTHELTKENQETDGPEPTNTIKRISRREAEDTKQSADATGEWKTYFSSGYSFSLSYPPELILEVDEGNTFRLTVRPQSERQDGIGSYLEIAPNGTHRESLFDSDANTSCQQGIIDFAGRPAKECRESRPDITFRNIRILDLSGLNWGNKNEISFAIAGKDPDLEAVFNRILNSFVFIK